jgi:hypothetical protein
MSISRRPTARHFAALHIDDLHQLHLTLLIDQGHHTFLNIVALKEVDVYFRDNIHNGVADAVYVVFHGVGLGVQK